MEQCRSYALGNWYADLLLEIWMNHVHLFFLFIYLIFFDQKAQQDNAKFFFGF